jgi:hypothetical protein
MSQSKVAVVTSTLAVLAGTWATFQVVKKLLAKKEKSRSGSAAKAKRMMIFRFLTHR